MEWKRLFFLKTLEDMSLSLCWIQCYVKTSSLSMQGNAITKAGGISMWSMSLAWQWEHVWKFPLHHGHLIELGQWKVISTGDQNGWNWFSITSGQYSFHLWNNHHQCHRNPLHCPHRKSNNEFLQHWQANHSVGTMLLSQHSNQAGKGLSQMGHGCMGCCWRTLLVDQALDQFCSVCAWIRVLKHCSSHVLSSRSIAGCGVCWCGWRQACDLKMCFHLL